MIIRFSSIIYSYLNIHTCKNRKKRSYRFVSPTKEVRQVVVGSYPSNLNDDGPHRYLLQLKVNTFCICICLTQEIYN